jgi:hypothetical protein
MKGKETPHLRHFEATKRKPNEQILGHLEGWIGEMMGKGDKKQHNGQFILTNERVCFCRKGIFGEVFETIPIAKLTSVETLSMMGYRVLRLHTSHDALAFKTFEQKDSFDAVYQTLEDSRDRAGGIKATVSTVDSSAPDIPGQIKKLAELRDQGVLSDSEFDAKKAELLARM